MKRWRPIFATILFTLTLPSVPVWAGKVLDLGRIEIKGAARGPEMQIIETGKIDSATVTHVLLREIRELESELLGTTPNRSPKKGKSDE